LSRALIGLGRNCPGGGGIRACVEEQNTGQAEVDLACVHKAMKIK
jgi:hypothetical protein